MKRALLWALATAGLAAADATGKWTGTLLIPADGGGETSSPAHLVLKQEGAALTGTAGPDAGEQHAIRNGKAVDGELTFEVATGKAVMSFALKQTGDEIRGAVTRRQEGRTETARLSVKREP